MRKRITTVLKGMSEQRLAGHLGITQPRVNQLKKNHPEPWVYFDSDRVDATPIRLEYLFLMKIGKNIKQNNRRKGKNNDSR